MNAKKIKKYSLITTASFMTLQLAACGAPTLNNMDDSIEKVIDNTDDETNRSQVPVNNTVEEIINIKDTEFYQTCEDWEESADGSAQCIDEKSPYYLQHFYNGFMFPTIDAMEESPIYNRQTHMATNNTIEEEIIDVKDTDFSKSCNEWKESEDGSAQCIDESSPYYAQHFFNGFMFATLGAMAGSAIYNANSDNNRRRGSSGGVVAPVNSNKNSTNAASNNNGINLNKNNSNDSQSNNTTNKNSYSSGKSGFSSGGAGRGGTSGS